MVDGKYHGRGDTTKHQLTDAEVARLHARRTARQLTGEQLIAREVARSPISPEDQTFTHLFVVAQPLASPPDLLTSLIGTSSLLASVREVESSTPGYTSLWPNLRLASNEEPRPRGAGYYSDGLVGRRFQPQSQSATENKQVDLEIRDDGCIVLFCGGASLEGRRDWNDTQLQYVHGGVVVALTRVIASLAGALGGKAGYAGSWLIAIGLTNLSGRIASAAYNNMRADSFPQYIEDEYAQATEAPTVELLNQPGAVTSRLVHRLLRALRDPTQGYEQWLVDPPA